MKSEFKQLINDSNSPPLVRELLEQARNAKDPQYDFEAGILKHRTLITSGAPVPEWANASLSGTVKGISLTTKIVGISSIPIVSAALVWSTWVVSGRPETAQEDIQVQPKEPTARVISQNKKSKTLWDSDRHTSNTKLHQPPISKADLSDARRNNKNATTEKKNTNANTNININNRRVERSAELPSAVSREDTALEVNHKTDRRSSFAIPSRKSLSPNRLATVSTATTPRKAPASEGIQTETQKEAQGKRAETPSLSKGIQTETQKEAQEERTGTLSSQKTPQQPTSSPSPSAQPIQSPSFASNDVLKREMRLLVEARRLINHDPSRSLILVKAPQPKSGLLSEEWEQIRLLAFLKLGRIQDVKVGAQRFHTQYPQSVFNERIKKELQKLQNQPK